jgi:hypothetical protein
MFRTSQKSSSKLLRIPWPLDNKILLAARTVLKALQLYNAPSDVQIVPFFSQADGRNATNIGSSQATFPP